MLDLVLERKSSLYRVFIKLLISIVSISLAIALPQIVHLFLGSSGGINYLPMYYPVIIAGAILGYKYGVAVGLISPILSYLLTLNNPMPALSRLPFMTFELMLFGLVSGLFSKMIYKNKWMSFVAVLVTAIIGRTLYLSSVAVFESISSLSLSLVYEQVISGLFGLGLLVILSSLIIILIRRILVKNEQSRNS